MMGMSPSCAVKVVTSHMWQLSTWNVAKELNFHFYLLLTNLNRDMSKPRTERGLRIYSFAALRAEIGRRCFLCKQRRRQKEGAASAIPHRAENKVLSSRSEPVVGSPTPLKRQ